MTTLAPSLLRNRVDREIGELLDQLPVDEQVYVLLSHLLKRGDPDRIPLKPDGHRISSEEARRRLAMRKDRQPTIEKET
jgi:hypothetical protein